MRELVVDASIALEWLRPSGANGPARLLEEFLAGACVAIAPPLVQLEVVNVAGRRWGWDGAGLGALAESLERLPFELVQPELHRVASWVARGLTAYDAAYVAVAERAGVPLVTLDTEILRVADGVARSPSDG
jgi:predicted nucleic acid-binding protein